MSLTLKPASDCRFDLVSLGEVMLRLDPGDARIHTARAFQVWEGGGEYNVARGLKRCFGLRTAVVTAFVDNPVGRLLQDLLYQGGVDQSHARFVPDDGVGRTVRNGLNFTERGFGVRAAVGCSDRGHTAASQMKPGDVDWDALFGKEGARWLHTGGIFAALSETTPLVAKEAMAAAKKHGTIVSYDLNFRASLWKSIGGKKRAQEVNRELASYVDVMLGNEEDFTAALGFEVEGLDENLSALDPANFHKMIEKAVAAFPNFRAVATTLRSVRSASVNDWAAVLYTGGRLYQSPAHAALEIWDRVGGGDSFASGLIYGFLAGKDPQWAVDCGAAHGALAMTTPGDTTMASLAEVERVMKGGSARVQR
jgi:2-dehydro-3-deoxygluconokinase